MREHSEQLPADLRTQSPATREFPVPQKHTPVLTDDEGIAQQLQALVNVNTMLKRISRQLFNYSHPVDEYQKFSSSSQSPVTIPVDYDLTVLYESALYSLPLGCTSAVLTIGTNRSITLYSGAAITVQQAQILPHLRMVAEPGDKRLLTVAGALTTEGYIGLMGHAYEREAI